MENISLSPGRRWGEHYRASCCLPGEFFDAIWLSTLSKNVQRGRGARTASDGPESASDSQGEPGRGWLPFGRPRLALDGAGSLWLTRAGSGSLGSWRAAAPRNKKFTLPGRSRARVLYRSRSDEHLRARFLAKNLSDGQRGARFINSGHSKSRLGCKIADRGRSRGRLKIRFLDRGTPNRMVERQIPR